MRGDNLKWENLKQKRCPKCSDVLMPSERDSLGREMQIYRCNRTCSFAIAADRLKTICAEMDRKDLEDRGYVRAI